MHAPKRVPARRRVLAGALLFSTGVHALLLWLSGRAGVPPAAAPLVPSIAVRLREPAPPPAAAAPALTPRPRPSVRAPAPLAGFGVAIGSGEQLADLSEVQLRYGTELPPSVELSFAVQGARSGVATLRWEVDATDGYRLEFRGPGHAASSSGVIGDNGIAPLEASDERNGSTRQTHFDRAARQLRFSATARSYPMVDSAQDALSVLMQLAGVGMANPQRLQQSIVFFVGGSEGAATVRFDPVGSERIDSAMGALDTEHLVQTQGAGKARLDVWLAPAYHWLPVQLRTTAPDGSTLTHTVTAITPGPAR